MTLSLQEVIKTGSVFEDDERNDICASEEERLRLLAEGRDELNRKIGTGVTILVMGGHDPHRQPFSRNPNDTIVLGYN